MYKLEWLDSSLDELTAVWLAANPATRIAVRMAVSMAESRLRHDPQFQGESREGNERVVFFDPLGFSVELDASRRTVTVLHVWRVRRRQ